jgi:tetratricopeptide (TPR) repeat protein
VIEFFDFDLQVPAIAILLAVVAGLAIRTTREEQPSAERHPRRVRAIAAVTIAFAVAMIAVSALQSRADYPYDLRTPRTLAQARATILSHPSSATAHREFVKLAGSGMPTASQLSELKIASQLDPTDPFTIDRIAQILAAQGDRADSMRNVTRSVFVSPDQSTHAYLSAKYAPQLSDDEQQAIEAGFRQAIGTGNSRAQEELANFYASVERYDEVGALRTDLAKSADDPAETDRLMLGAADAYQKAGDDVHAESAFRAAIAAAPDDYTAYAGLISIAINSRRDFAAARAEVAKGIANGVDPVRLNLAMADIARRVGDADDAEQAYKEAMRQSPYSIPLLMQVTRFYLDNGDHNQAIETAQHAVDISPQDAQVRFNLGLAEEAGYRYSDADDAFTKAISLAPDNTFYKGYHNSFQRKLTKNSDPATPH